MSFIGFLADRVLEKGIRDRRPRAFQASSADKLPVQCLKVRRMPGFFPPRTQISDDRGTLHEHRDDVKLFSVYSFKIIVMYIISDLIYILTIRTGCEFI
jgi:hypothetical protein